MKRYDVDQHGFGDNAAGEFVLYEEASVIEADRDTQQANLRLLAGLICSFADNLDFDALRAAIGFARSVKQ